jgi:hypothetical protein
MPRDPQSSRRAVPHDQRERTAEHQHSAFEEFRRDERRPAVLLLGALLIAALFFALGIMLGRWMDDDNNAPAQGPSNGVNQSSTSPVAPLPRP